MSFNNFLIKYNRTIVIIGVSVFLCIYLYLHKPSDIERVKINSIDSLIVRPLSGIVTSIKYQSHGHYYIGMFDKINNDSLKYSLYGHYLFDDNYNIKVGDSISKDVNSIIIIFHSYESKRMYKKGVVYKLPNMLPLQKL